MSNTCKNHPEREGVYHCAKYNRYLCKECLKCQDPSIFCKYRSSCIIWEITKYGTSEEQEKRGSTMKSEWKEEQ